MFLSRNKKTNVYPCKPQFLYIKVGFKGVKLYRYVFVMIRMNNYTAVAAVERFPVHYHSADYILFPLGSLGLLWYIEKWSSAHYTLEGVSSFANVITTYEESQ